MTTRLETGRNKQIMTARENVARLQAQRAAGITKPNVPVLTRDFAPVPLGISLLDLATAPSEENGAAGVPDREVTANN